MASLEKVRVQVLDDLGNVTKEVDVLTSADCVTFEDGETFQQKYNSGVLKGEKGEQGLRGNDGKTAYQIYVDSLQEGDTQLTEQQWIASLKGEKGDRGEQGLKGDKGETGLKGDKGDPFTIRKTYTSVSEMEADFSNSEILEGSFVIIDTGNVEDEDNAKLYVKGSSSYTFITDLSGATGIKGEKGEKGDNGDEIKIGETPETSTTAKLFFKIVN